MEKKYRCYICGNPVSPDSGGLCGANHDAWTEDIPYEDDCSNEDDTEED